MLTVVVQPWSGWSRERIQPARLHFVAQAGQTITAELLGYPTETYTISIGGINALGIELIYRGLVTRNSNGTINLSAPTTGSLILLVGKSVRLATATTDAGTSIDVTLDAVK